MTTVLTTVLGGHDLLRDAPKSSARFICYTDNPALRSKTWKIRLVSGELLNPPRRLARKIKTLVHQYVTDDEIVLWVDARFQITRDPVPMIKQVLARHDIALHYHPSRTRVTDEGEECARLGLDTRAKIAVQVRSVVRRGGDYPLYATGILARRMTPKMKELGRFWWKEIEAHTLRDQLSFTVALKSIGIVAGQLPGPSVWSTPGFVTMKHVKKRKVLGLGA